MVDSKHLSLTPQPPLFLLDRLGEAYDRSVFSCGQESLDRYFKTQATQDIKRHVANCFVAVETASGRVAAYYTLAAASVPMTDLPAELTKKLPRYPSFAAALIGRLAVDENFQRRGLGGALLADATHRIIASAPAAHLILVDAKDEAAADFYRNHGFVPIVGRARTLVLPVTTALKATAAAAHNPERPYGSTRSINKQ